MFGQCGFSLSASPSAPSPTLIQRAERSFASRPRSSDPLEPRSGHVRTRQLRPNATEGPPLAAQTAADAASGARTRMLAGRALSSVGVVHHTSAKLLQPKSAAGHRGSSLLPALSGQRGEALYRQQMPRSSVVLRYAVCGKAAGAAPRSQSRTLNGSTLEAVAKQCAPVIAFYGY
mmetsp:Transcript_54652/g.119225  ORF Transcript_54652/g.119225 Transcript_54652/m.119225 type:complete len:175 (+) Transcript_54652:74-598(+)